MESTSFFQQLMFALFAFVMAAAPAMGTSPRELTLEYSLNPFGIESTDNCDIDPPPFDVVFYYYSKNGTGVLDFNDPPSEGLKNSEETKILTHGFRGSVEKEEFQEVVKAYLKGKEYVNLITLDWSNYTSGMYRDAARSAIAIGRSITSLFCFLYKNYDIYPYQIHFIGHNLGAHLWGAASSESRVRVGRITALDPARLCFEIDCSGVHLRRLSAEDAIFVDVLHTDAGQSGITKAEGMADFYANKGRFQPRCHLLRLSAQDKGDCDSLSSYLYFAESILIPGAFYGSYCLSPYLTVYCDKEGGAFWGEYMDVAARGVFHFKTRAQSPYGEGRNLTLNGPVYFSLT